VLKYQSLSIRKKTSTGVIINTAALSRNLYESILTLKKIKIKLYYVYGAIYIIRKLNKLIGENYNDS